MKANCKAYYIRNNKRMTTQARIACKINRKNKLVAANALSKILHALNPELLNNKNKASKQIKSRRYSKFNYSLNPEKKESKGIFSFDLQSKL